MRYTKRQILDQIAEEVEFKGIADAEGRQRLPDAVHRWVWGYTVLKAQQPRDWDEAKDGKLRWNELLGRQGFVGRFLVSDWLPKLHPNSPIDVAMTGDEERQFIPAKPDWSVTCVISLGELPEITKSYPVYLVADNGKYIVTGEVRFTAMNDGVLVCAGNGPLLVNGRRLA